MTDQNAALLAANEHLLQLRQQAQKARKTAVSRPNCSLDTLPQPRPLSSRISPNQAGGAANTPRAAGRSPSSWEFRNALAYVAMLQEMIGKRPSTAVSHTAPEETAVAGRRPADDSADRVTAVSSGSVTAPLPIDGPPKFKVWPALANALKQAQFAPHYRLYVASQLLDPQRSGRVEIAQIRANFTEKNGRYLFSWRRVRQVLHEGDGVLWHWNQKTNVIHLAGVKTIAAALGVARVDRPVILPETAVFAGQGQFNAHLHAAWLTGHGDETKPISQAAIKAATAVPERTQRHYNHVAGVQRQKNLEIGERHTETTEEETAWRYGRASFEFVDYLGRRGQPDGRYRARRLPDSYRPRHRLAAKGRRRKINRELARLVEKEEQGSSGGRLTKRYFANGQEAARAYNRRPDQPAHWPDGFAGQWRAWNVLL